MTQQEKAIVDKIFQQPLDNWEYTGGENMYLRYKIIINGYEVWLEVNPPSKDAHFKINKLLINDERIQPFFEALERNYNEQRENRTKKLIENIYNAFFGVNEPGS